MDLTYKELVDALSDVTHFAEQASEIKLRSYQEAVARAVVESVIQRRGLTFVVIFPRQSGKNELQAQIEAYLLTVFSMFDAEIVKVSPTWKPQSLNAMRRLERVLKRNFVTGRVWHKEQSYVYRVGRARVYFLSGSPTANVVGATASTLLECDEAQDVLVSKWDKDIAPMAASTNATRVFWGTAWTSRTLLARELRAARQAQAEDGIRRVFTLTAEEVAREVPAYGHFVAQEIQKHGREHPFVKTQYYSEEIDGEGGMFSPARIARMQGEHSRAYGPVEGSIYALLIDVAGEDEGASDLSGSGMDLLANPARDATALTVVEVDLSTMADELIRRPTYKVINRRMWVGASHTSLYGIVRSEIELWQARYVVVDATGVGSGLAAFLGKAFPERVIPFVFNASTKSKLGWDFLTIIESGRFKDHERPERKTNFVQPDEQGLFLQQLAHCQMEVIPGPDRRMKWGVPAGVRDQATGELVHDDLVLSAALCGVLEELEWGLAVSEVIAGVDPLADLKEIF